MIRWWWIPIVMIAAATAGVLIYAIVTSGTIVDLQLARDASDGELARVATANNDLRQLLDDSRKRAERLEDTVTELRNISATDKRIVGRLQEINEGLATELAAAYRISRDIEAGISTGQDAVARARQALRRIESIVKQLDFGDSK